MPTVNKLFGIADPQYDALRVLSTQALEAGPGDGTSGGGGLENKIYLWPTDGSTITVYDPTQAGLIAALAAAASGDTVWLPSIAIPVTAAVSVPAGVSMVGIDDNAVLSFSGFSGTALTLAADSAIARFSLTFTATGTTAIGVNAQAAGALVLLDSIVVNGGSTSNIGVLIGAATVRAAKTLWASGENIGDHGIFYCDPNETSPVWTQTTTDPDSNPAFWLGYASDESYLYVATSATDQPGTFLGWPDHLYKCANPKDATPIWTCILQAGDSTPFGTVVKYFDYTIGPMVIRGTTLSCMARVDPGGGHLDWAFGQYDGAAWTWLSFKEVLTSTVTICGPDFYGVTAGVYDSAGTGIDAVTGIDAFGGWPGWKNESGDRYYFYIDASESDLYLRSPGSSLQLLNGSSVAAADVINSFVIGAPLGDQVIVIAYDGKLWLSDDGAAFTNVVTWREGRGVDMLYDGGGQVIWMCHNPQSDNIAVRLYSRAGAVVRDLTGNLDSLMTLGSAQMYGLALTYTGSSGGDSPWLQTREITVTGTGSIGVKVSDNAIIDDTHMSGVTADLSLDSGAIAYLNGANTYSTTTGTGSIEPLSGDRAAWDTDGFPDRHAQDISVSAFTYHNDPGNPPLSQTLTDGHIFVGNGSNIATDVAMSNDATMANTGALTLKNTGPGATGPLGSATVAPIITIDAQGRVTALSSATITGVTPAAHQLDGALHTVSGLTPGYILTALTATTFGFAAAPAGSVPQIYNETISADGVSTIYYLLNVANPGTIRVYINGVRQPASDDIAPTDVVQFSSPPALGALLLFDYEMEIT